MNLSARPRGPGAFNRFFDVPARAVEAGVLPSAVAGVADASGPVEIRGYGTRPDGRPVGPGQEYALFSVTKPIVAVAIAQLWERGRLLPTDEVSRFIPGFGARRAGGDTGADTVRVWHLLTHTSGIEEEPAAGQLLAGLAVPPFAESARDAVARFAAGSRKRYCSLSFGALSEIVRVAGEADLEAWLRREVFLPLGMSGTSLEAYARDPGRIMPVERSGAYAIDHYLRSRHPAGGLVGTVPDLLRLGAAMLGGGAIGRTRVLGAATVRTMTRPQTVGIPPEAPGDFDGFELGYGWFVSADNRRLIAAPGDTYGHDGWSGCMLWMYPRAGACFALCTNLLDPGLHGFDPSHVHNAFASCLP